MVHSQSGFRGITTSEKGEKIKKEAFSWLKIAAMAFVMAIITQVIIMKTEVVSGSMIPELEIGDHVIGNRLVYLFSDPERGDVIFFEYPLSYKELYDIKLMSWYPLGHGDKSLINEPVFAELGKKYGKSPAQIILRWHTQMGFVVIPGSKNVDHIKDNLNILDFKLTDEEMRKIAELDKNERYYHRTDEQLVQFAGWRPTFEKA